MAAQQKLGRYTLTRKLATGGMAEIWLAQAEGPAGFEKQVVIKRILHHLGSDPKFVEMFLDEARLAAQLSHPNIAQIHELGEENGEYFIAMEYVAGRDLATIIERSQRLGTPIPALIAARLIADACSALEYAHNFRLKSGEPAGLVHRDVSPQNILVSRDGIVKLIDFGVAKASSASHKTQTGAVKGKLSYMSPEQIQARVLDGRSDIFALGIVLYELATSQRPFGHDSELLAITAILNQAPIQPRELRAELPSELDEIILKALEKDPVDRFASAGQMQRELEQTMRRAGVFLSPRDIADYFEDLFSENPTGSLPALVPTMATAGSTNVLTPGGPTRPDSSLRPPLVPPPAAPDPAPDTTRRSLMIGVVILGVVLASAFALYKLVLAPAPAPVATAAAPTAVAATAGAATAGSAATTAAATAPAAALPSAQAPTGTAGAPTAPSAAVPSAVAPTATAAAPTAAVAVPTEVAPAAATAVAPTATSATPTATAPAATEAAAEPEEEEREPSAAATGRITFRFGAGRQTIYIDGRKVGEVPGSANNFRVPPGRHAVRVTNAYGGKFETTVNVSSGQNVEVRVQY